MTMTANAVIAGSFADIKSVKSRSVVVLMIEVPIERAADVVAMFGYPQPGEEVPVAVARLMPLNPEAPVAPPAPEKSKRGWDELSHAQQAGIVCGEVGFHRWIKVETPDEAAAWVREHCGVTSRRELDTNETAATAWNRLVGRYRDFERYGDMR
jgi:hypothetical protein